MTNPSQIYVNNTPMFMPELVELAAVLQNGLKNHYKEASVELVDCPDLTQEPFNLAASGLCGDAIIVKIGQPSNLFCQLDSRLQMKYCFKELLKLVYNKYSNALIFGETYGLRQSTQQFCDFIMNASFLKITRDYYLATNKSRFGFMDDLTQRYIYEPITDPNPACYLHGNLFITEGKPGKVLRVYARKSLTNLIFPVVLHEVLHEKYSSLSDSANPKIIGLGGTYMTKDKEMGPYVKRSCRNQSRMPEIIDNWNYRCNLKPRSVAVGTIFVNCLNDNSHLLSLGQQAYNILLDVHFKALFIGETSTFQIESSNTEDFLGYFYPATQFYRLDPLSTIKSDMS